MKCLVQIRARPATKIGICFRMKLREEKEEEEEEGVSM